jgi:hypothetical protein
MQQTIQEKIHMLLAGSRRRRLLRKFVQVMCSIVVFITTYMLILPAITLEQQTFCGMEEHSHATECYEPLVCGASSTECHVHTEDCYSLPEASAHIHSDACEDPVRGDLICTAEETPGHTHGSVCFFDKKYRRIFTGDTINDGMLLQKSYECTALSTYVASVKKLLARRKEFDTILRCHGQPVGTHGDMFTLIDMVQGIIDGKNECTHFVNPMRDCWNYNFGRYSISCDGPDAEL